MWNLFGLLGSPKKESSNAPPPTPVVVVEKVVGVLPTAAGTTPPPVKRSGSDKTSDTLSETVSESEEEGPWRTAGGHTDDSTGSPDDKGPAGKKAAEGEPAGDDAGAQPVSLGALKSILGGGKVSIGAPPSTVTATAATPSKPPPTEASVNALKSLLLKPNGAPTNLAASPPAASKIEVLASPPPCPSPPVAVEAASVNALKKLLTVPIAPAGASIAAAAVAKDALAKTQQTHGNNNKPQEGNTRPPAKPQQKQPQQQHQHQHHNGQQHHQGQGQGQHNNGQQGRKPPAVAHHQHQQQYQQYQHQSAAPPKRTGPPAEGPTYYASSSILSSPAPTALPLPAFELDHSDFFDGFDVPPPPAHVPGGVPPGPVSRGGGADALKKALNMKGSSSNNNR